MAIDRTNWIHDVEEVIRSRHYTWLPKGLGGEPVDVAMAFLVADIMHVCKRTGTSFEDVLEASRRQFAEEERRLEAEQREAESETAD